MSTPSSVVKRQVKVPVAETTVGDEGEGVEPVVKKGITLRPANIRKLDVLELALRNRGLKSSHSGLEHSRFRR